MVCLLGWGERTVFPKSLMVRVLGCLHLVVLLALVSGGAVYAQSVDRAEIREWKERDDPSTCDEIGWDAGAIVGGTPTNEDYLHHGACVGSVIYIAACGTIDGDGMFFGPSPGEMWIACLIIAANAGNDEAMVSPFDFSLVDANGRKYDQDFMAQASLNPDAMFPTETLRREQSVSGAIAFSVPRSADLPYVLEVDPMLSFSFSSPDPGSIVITRLQSIDELAGEM